MRREELSNLELPDDCHPFYKYDEEAGEAWADIPPSCLIKGMLLPCLRRRKIIEQLLATLEEEIN